MEERKEMYLIESVRREVQMKEEEMAKKEVSKKDSRKEKVKEAP
jgi:hypothetical protein